MKKKTVLSVVISRVVIISCLIIGIGAADDIAKMKTLNQIVFISILAIIVLFCWDKASMYIPSDKEDKKFDESDD